MDEKGWENRAFGPGLGVRQDEAKWITSSQRQGRTPTATPSRAGRSSSMTRPGSILGGMGGKGKGKKLTDFKTSRKKMTFKSPGSASKSEGTTSGGSGCYTA